jgi:hypothetical protein
VGDAMGGEYDEWDDIQREGLIDIPTHPPAPLTRLPTPSADVSGRMASTTSGLSDIYTSILAFDGQVSGNAGAVRTGSATEHVWAGCPQASCLLCGNVLVRECTGCWQQWCSACAQSLAPPAQPCLAPAQHRMMGTHFRSGCPPHSTPVSVTVPVSPAPDGGVVGGPVGNDALVPAVLAPEQGVVCRPVGQGQEPHVAGLPNVARVLMWGIFFIMILSPTVEWAVQTNDLLVDSAGHGPVSWHLRWRAVVLYLAAWIVHLASSCFSSVPVAMGAVGVVGLLAGGTGVHQATALVTQAARRTRVALGRVPQPVPWALLIMLGALLHYGGADCVQRGVAHREGQLGSPMAMLDRG